MNGATIIGWVIFATAIAVSIALHEMGHLLPAKRFGVKVTQYMVGFGPTVWSRHKGETEYGIKAIPLGGYIRMIGMFPPKRLASGEVVTTSNSTGIFRSIIDGARAQSAEEVTPGDEDRVFYKLKTRQKLTVMLGGPTMNLILAAVFFTIAMSVFGAPQLTMRIASVIPCVPAAQSSTCAPGDPRSPAAEAGLRKGDTIVAVAGTPVSSWTQASQLIRDEGGKRVIITVDRNGQTIDVPVSVVTTSRPSLTDPTKNVDVGYIGVSPSIEQVRQPVTAVPGQMWNFTAKSAQAVVSIPAKMAGVWGAAFDGQQRNPNGPVSIVGVGRFSGEVTADHAGWTWKAANIFMIVAALNMALFLFNLIPLLPLDGGHVAGALYEAAKRHIAKWRHRPDPGPVDVAKAMPLAYAVAIALIGMSVLLIYADVVNPIKLS